MSMQQRSEHSLTPDPAVGNAFAPNATLDPDVEDGASVEVEIPADEAPIEAATPSTDAREQAARSEASLHGWVDRDEWVAQGKPVERWRPATEFLEVRNGILGIVRQENAQLKARLAAMEAAQKAKAEADAEARAKLTEDSVHLELKQALEEQDWDKVRELNDRLIEAKLARTQAKPKQPQYAPEVVAALQSFAAENPWLKTDRELAGEFQVELKLVVDSGAASDMEHALGLARARVARAHPEKFRTAPRRAPMVETGGGSMDAPARSGKLGWSDLKPDVRRVAEADIAAGRYDKATFLRTCAEDPRAYFQI